MCNKCAQDRNLPYAGQCCSEQAAVGHLAASVSPAQPAMLWCKQYSRAWHHGQHHCQGCLPGSNCPQRCPGATHASSQVVSPSCIISPLDWPSATESSKQYASPLSPSAGRCDAHAVSCQKICLSFLALQGMFMVAECQLSKTACVRKAGSEGW